MTKHLESPLVCLPITAILLLVFVFGRLYQSRFDPTSFIVAGDYYCDPLRVPPKITVLRSSYGYDGQFYYRLALNPLTSQKTEFGITLDSPPLRHQRVLYPLLSWAISLGHREFVPTAMILLNFLALCLMGWIGGTYARTLQRHALWGMLFPLYPGYLLSLSRDTTEILEATIVLASLLLLRSRRFFWATLLLTLAVLTRETAVLVAGAAAGVYVLNLWKSGSKDRVPWYYATAPITTFIVWQFVLFRIWGEFPILASTSNLGIPFAAFIGLILSAARLHRRLQLADLAFLAGFTSAVLYCIRWSKTVLHEVFSWLLVAVLVFCLAHVVWVEDWAFMRVFSLVYALGTIIIVSSGHKVKVKYAVFLCCFLLWIAHFAKLMRHYS